MEKFKKILGNHKWPLLILFLTWGVYFLALWPRVIQMRKDGLYLGHVNVWSDWALHIGIANIFAFKAPQYWFAYHPMYAGGKFTYGFLTDAISGLLIRFGMPFTLAFIIPSIIFTLALLLGMYALLYQVLKSKWKPLAAISFFFLSSGLGFVNFRNDFLTNPSWQAFLNPIKEYSRVDSLQWYAGNYITGMLLPQRGFLLGMAISVWIIAALFYVWNKAQPSTRHCEEAEQSEADVAIQGVGKNSAKSINSGLPRSLRLARNDEFFYKIILLLSGIFAGILVITHIHSFIVLVIITGLLCLSFIKKWNLFLWYVIPAGIVSSILYWIFIYGGIINQNQFFTWFPGWTLKGGFFEWAKMWLYFWGATIPAAILGLAIFWKKMSWQVRTFFISFFIIFGFSNLFLTQPIAWDNSKLFLWAYFGFSTLATLIVFWLWNKKWFGKIAAVVLIFLLTATGVLEVIRIQRTDKNSYMETNIENIRLGQKIRQETDPLAVFLTSTDHNSFIMIWANRPILMGYTAWVMNYGFPYQQRWEDMNIMYAGGPETNVLLKKYNISYVVIGSGEIYNFHAKENYFSSNFPLAFQDSSYRIYDVRKLLK